MCREDLVDNQQLEHDNLEAEFEERLKHQISVHHAQMLIQKNNYSQLQSLYEALQLEMSQIRKSGDLTIQLK